MFLFLFRYALVSVCPDMRASRFTAMLVKIIGISVTVSVMSLFSLGDWAPWNGASFQQVPLAFLLILGHGGARTPRGEGRLRVRLISWGKYEGGVVGELRDLDDELVYGDTSYVRVVHDES